MSFKLEGGVGLEFFGAAAALRSSDVESSNTYKELL